MKTSIRILPFFLFTLWMVSAACSRPAPVSETLTGHWELTPDSRERADRACMVLSFPPPGQPSFEIALIEPNWVLRFNDPGHTSWRGSTGTRNFTARQFLPTSSVGSFCGRQIQVQLRLHTLPDDPDMLLMEFETPDCNVCTAFTLTATRVTVTKKNP
ncbi:MAG: hypothetical protein JJU29_20680 [Verrucomicrobia bacterium]|nr:hypothetical protein [Verrucomicrobiota bacterium]MCH8514482.1 hypothetical protein [Kiritimatiellia bacterium]